jgi:hypothetical protein
MNEFIEFLGQQPYKDLLEIMDKITIVVAFITLFFVLRNWNNNKKQLKAIKIYFKIKCLGKYILIEDKLTRKDARRSEIQGILANKLIKGVTRYNIDYLGSEQYFKYIFDLQNTKIDYVIIELENDELAQFADLIIDNLEKKEIFKIKNSITDFMNSPSEILKKGLKNITVEKLGL